MLNLQSALYFSSVWLFFFAFLVRQRKHRWHKWPSDICLGLSGENQDESEAEKFQEIQKLSTTSELVCPVFTLHLLLKIR